SFPCSRWRPQCRCVYPGGARKAMKLLFSEAPPDYSRYHYPYVVWGFLEAAETPADAFAAGFLPGLPSLERWYLVRQLRVPLGSWSPTSENRRTLRKASGLRCELLAKADFDFTAERRARWLEYAARRWGPGIMPAERLERVISGAVISHVLHFTDATTGRDAGTALLHVEAPRMAFYYYAFFDAAPEARHIGMAMMTRAVEWFAAAGFGHLHLGTCYSERALYKTQFTGVEFFNGFRWSPNLAELKHLVRSQTFTGHRLEDPEFLAFQPEPPPRLAGASAMRCA
ncbi:MAG: hypothetical protein J0L84_19265, partial [Verrucomicrobia bacterium]|nr:hypothetical protein [Verrucomicrobiota bacterium]